MKNILTLLLAIASICLTAQTYKDGNVIQKIYDKKNKIISNKSYGNNAIVEVTDYGYRVSFHSVSSTISLKLIFIRNTGSGKKYSDEHEKEYYIEDDMEDIGTFKIIDVKIANDTKTELVFDRLENKPENHFKYKSE